jgi:hypothetical protein
MASNGLVTPVVDGPGIQNRFGGADDVFDRPECLVDVSDRLGIVEGIGAQNPEPVIAGFGFNLLFINREMMRLGGDAQNRSSFGIHSYRQTENPREDEIRATKV